MRFAGTAPWRFRAQGARGFTLIELLVVIVIIGIVITVASLSTRLRDPLDELVAEGERLASLMRLASSEAVSRSAQYGVGIAETGYRFYRNDGSDWLELNDRIFRARSFTDDIHARLAIEDMPVLISASPGARRHGGSVPATARARPQILLLSSGEITPFELVLERPESRTVVRLSSSWEEGVATATLPR